MPHNYSIINASKLHLCDLLFFKHQFVNFTVAVVSNIA
jgi:hypothetical protein